MVTDMLSCWVTLKEQNRTVIVFAAPLERKAGSMLTLPLINYLLRSQQLVC